MTHITRADIANGDTSNSLLTREVFIEDLRHEVVEIFNREPLEKQPQAIVDVNCINGSLLEDIFRIISTLTTRGRHLAEMPVRLVSVGNDREALEEAAKRLAKLQHHTLLAEIHQPEKLSTALEQCGLTSEQEALQVRLFVDHRIEVDAQQPVNQALTVLGADEPAHYLDRQGRSVDALAVLSCWQQHFRSLAQSFYKSRLLILEAHAIPSQLIAQQPA